MARYLFTGALGEARRRNVFRDAGLYVVGAWVILQVAEIAFPALGIPEASLRYVWAGVLILFPISVFFGWRYEIEAGRIVRTRVAGDEAGQPLKRIDYLILSALFAATAALTIGLAVEISASRAPIIEMATVDDIDPASIAVLPFVNMSPDPDNDYLADGIAEELLNGLALVPELRVTARTSSFAFKGQAVDIRTIAQKLGVAHVLEGSVRASGDKLRITAQLIHSKDGTHEWSETYERDMQDVFTIQDDITQNVVSALSTTLGVAVDESVRSGSTRNMQAYTHFLRGNQIIRNFSGILFGGGGTLGSEDQRPSPEQVKAWYFEAIAHFQSAIELDPQFGDAYAALAGAYFWGAGYEPDPDARKEMRMTSRSIAEKAVSVSPGSSEGLRLAANLSDDYEEKKALLRQAIELDPNNVEAMTTLAWVLMDLGRENADYDLEEALELARRAVKLDPLNFRSAFTLAEPLWRTGRLKEAAEAWVLSAAMRRGSLSTKPEEAEDLPDAPVNVDFQRGVVGWSLDEACRQGAELSTIRLPELDGQVVVTKNGCEFSQKFLAGPYHDKYIRLAVNFKVKGADSHAFLRMGMLDSDGYVVNRQEGTHEKVWGDSEWTERRLPLYVPDQAEVIGIKVSVGGSGEVWMDDLRVEVADNPEFENAVRIGEYD